MTLLITGIIVWLIAIVFILRFFAVCKEIKRRPKPLKDLTPTQLIWLGKQWLVPKDQEEQEPKEHSDK